jgi:hypothetical protein
MAGRANLPIGPIYRVVNLGTATIVEDGIRDEDKAQESDSVESSAGFRRALRGRSSDLSERRVASPRDRRRLRSLGGPVPLVLQVLPAPIERPAAEPRSPGR